MIILPKRFKKKLDKNESNLDIEWGKIHKNFSQIYSENNLFFFNEYTDHGFRHINSVLNAIDKLITDETWRLLSEKDVFIIITSTFLHDLGMHLQPLTFKALIEGEYESVKQVGFNDISWVLLWDNYLEEAKKWNEEKLINVFGDSSVEIHPIKLDKIDRINEIDKKLVGEFIRRHHPRIAFEVAFKGLKSHNGNFIDLFSNLNEDWRFISGIVARSHGMYVRETFELLKKKYLLLWKEPKGVHIIYIMILLRLGDYLQIDEKRIYRIPFETKLFSSPQSLFEHEKHFCILEYQELKEDTETIYFNTNPTYSLLYVSLRRLFQAIQNEFDTSWAILGEIYGYNLRQQFKLKYRRIKSNLDDPTFLENLPYIPRLITFTVDRELLKLLIAPLYGNDPSFGIRELLQNSIDACRERAFLEKNNVSNQVGVISLNFDIDNKKRTIFIIKDTGKGMTSYEIEEYFLKAGSSLRKSEDWKKYFVKENKTPAIHRIGKFGIGVLAAFLLGNEIKVETRHVNSQVGYFFNTKIEDSYVEIHKSNELSIGTKIIIYVSDVIRDVLIRSVRDRLTGKSGDILSFSGLKKTYTEPNSRRWDKWYILKEPAITIKVYNFPEFVPFENPYPSFDDELPSGWKEFKTKEYEKILWTYNKNNEDYFVCNGMIIPQRFNWHGLNQLSLNLRRPSVSIFDFKGNLKLDINRNSILDNELPFENELLEEIYKDIVTNALTLTPAIPDLNNCISINKESKLFFSYPGFEGRYNLIYFRDGFIINMPYLKKSAVDKVVLGFEFSFMSTNYREEIRIQLDEQHVSPMVKITSKNWDEHKTVPFQNDLIREYIKTNIKFDGDIQKKIINSYTLNLLDTVIEDEEKFNNFCQGLKIEDTVIPYKIVDRRKKFAFAFEMLKITEANHSELEETNMNSPNSELPDDIQLN